MIFHPDKTSIGPLSKGFSFLGYSYKKGRWKIRPETIVQSLGKIRELLESRCKEKTAIARSQLPRWVNRQKKPAPSVVEYVTRFLGWAVRGLTHLPLSIPTPGKLIHTAERLSSLPYNLI